MDINEACRVIEGARGDAILVATMGAMTAFDQLGAAQPRINSVPLMGGAASIGLGLAIGRPDRRLIVVDGDASLLMQLGGLATVAERQPRNFHHFVIRNGTQFSGFSNLATPAEEIVDFAAMAKAAGYRRASGFDDGFAFAEALPAILAEEGPVFTELRVTPPPPIPGANTQFEIPPQQFVRMGAEAIALSAWLAERGND